MPPDGGTVTPNLAWDQAAADTAAGRIGHVAYALLRSQSLVAIPQMRASLRVVDAALVQAIELAKAEGRENDPETRQHLDRLMIATHWEVITRLGIAVENLTAIMEAIERYRAGTGDIAEALLKHDLDLLMVLGERRRRRMPYWDSVSARDSFDKPPAGLEKTHLENLKATHRRWAWSAIGRFDAVRTYYTPALHQVYLRYKHGYTLVGPHASQLRLGRGAERAAKALPSGFAVAHQTRDGRRVLQVVRSGPEEIHNCIRAAHQTVDLAGTLANLWLFELEHPRAITIAFDTGIDPDALIAWLGKDTPRYDEVMPYVLAELSKRPTDSSP